MRSIRVPGAILAALTLAIATGGSAGATPDRPAGTFPTSISLPKGFQPEGIATGLGPFAFIGSMADGSIYRADLRTGRGAIFSRGPGTPSLGMKIDPPLRHAADPGHAVQCRRHSPPLSVGVQGRDPVREHLITEVADRHG